MQAGSVVECREKKRVFCAVCLDIRPNNVRLLLGNNKEVTLPSDKVLSQTNHRLDIERSRLEILESLKDIEIAIEKARLEVNLAELWEVVHEEEPSFSLDELAGLLWDRESSSDRRSALLRELLADTLYFDFKDDRFFPRPASQVKALQQQRQRAEMRQQEQQQALEVLKLTWEEVRVSSGVGRSLLSPAVGDNRSRTAGARASDEGCGSPSDVRLPVSDLPWLPLLQGLVLRGEHFDRYSDGVDLLRQVGVAVTGASEAAYAAFRLLVGLGIWQPDENLALLRLQVPQRFNRAALEEAASLDLPELATADGREDLRWLDAFTIDDPDTTDMDDALSFRPVEGGMEVGIHIADPAHFIPPGSSLDKEANERATSIYLPDSKVEMLPERLSQDLCSLVAGRDRLSISVLSVLDGEGRLVSYRLVESVVRVARRLTYQEVNRLIETGTVPFVDLFALARRLQRRRVEAGAQIQDRPQLKIRVDLQRNVTIERISPDQPSQILVSECMILANQIVAQFFHERQIPAIYRVQSPPETPLESEAPVRLKGAEFTTRPAAHFSLGLAAYLQITSPIRRYIDLVLHRQLKAALRHLPSPYNEAQLNLLLASSEQARSAAAQVERETNRYWLLKYLQGKGQETFSATVVDVQEGRAFLHIEDYLLDTFLYPRHRALQPGEAVQVSIGSVDPYRRSITFVLVDGETSSVPPLPDGVGGAP